MNLRHEFCFLYCLMYTMFDNCPFFFCSVYMHKMLRVMLTSLVISGWWNLGYIVFLHMAFPPLWIMSMCLPGKASQRTASPPHAPPHENDLGPGTFPCREIKRCSSQPVLGISLRLPLSILGLICSSLFCLSMCATWHLTSPTATSVPSGEGVETFACRPSLHQPQGETHWPWGPTLLTVESDVALFLLCASKALHPMPGWVVFLGNPATCKSRGRLTSWGSSQWPALCSLLSSGWAPPLEVEPGVTSST